MKVDRVLRRLEDATAKLRGLTLWRTTRAGRPANTPGAFWTPTRSYPRYVHVTVADFPLWRATLDPAARIKRVAEMNERVLAAARRQGDVQVVVAPIWDWAGADEYVVLDPTVLRDVRRVRE